MLWLEEAGLHRHSCPGSFLRGRLWNRRGQVRIWLMVGYRSILRFKPLECLHLAGTHSFGSAQFIPNKVVALANLLLDGALNIGECVFWIAPARPSECMAQESQAVGIRFRRAA